MLNETENFCIVEAFMAHGGNFPVSPEEIYLHECSRLTRVPRISDPLKAELIWLEIISI